MWEGAGFGNECISVICAGQELNKVLFEKCKTGNPSYRKTVALFDSQKVSTVVNNCESANWNEMKTSFALEWNSK